jgi:hypothetical protein
MAITQKLTVDEVREYISDYAINNHLIDGEEFSDSFIALNMDLAIDEFNIVPPATGYRLDSFPSKAILMNGTLWKMFEGKAALFARNTMSYSDGGLQIPIEEKTEAYRALSGDFQAIFNAQVRSYKIHINMESGWGEVRSDQSMFPVW